MNQEPNKLKGAKTASNKASADLLYQKVMLPMHMWCRNVTHDVTALPNDATFENKRRTSDAARPKHLNTELPKMNTKPKTGITRIAGCST